MRIQGVPAKVTLVGNGRAQLETRARVLTHFWETEVVALDEGQTPDYETHLMIVFETLPEPERQDWVQRARAEKPGLLLVKINGYDSGPHAGADATVDETHGPGALVSTIYELLTERDLPSRAWPSIQEDVRIQ